jgi:ribose-phosphate pyrophosphokinase
VTGTPSCDSLFAFPDSLGLAREVAVRLGIAVHEIGVRAFPDGESLVRIEASGLAPALVVAFSPPNARLVETLLAASVLRRQGARSLTLLAPYLPYMRQDAAFRPGEAVSQKVVGAWMAGAFDRIVTVDPHLHRTGDLADVFPGTRADALTAGEVIGRMLAEEAGGRPGVVVGPDEEAEGLARAVAEAAGWTWVVGTKMRRGDRDVVVELPAGARLAGLAAVVVDDVISSGATVCRGAEAVLAAGAVSVEVVAVHALFDRRADSAFRKAAIRRVRSCDGVPHPSNAVALAPLLATAFLDGR